MRSYDDGIQEESQHAGMKTERSVRKRRKQKEKGEAKTKEQAVKDGRRSKFFKMYTEHHGRCDLAEYLKLDLDQPPDGRRQADSQIDHHGHQYP